MRKRLPHEPRPAVFSGEFAVGSPEEAGGLPRELETLHEAAYVDRFARMRLPVEVAEKLAQAYAAAEPEIVLMFIEDEENEYRSKGYEPGERFWHDRLREKWPGFALAR